MSVKIWYWVLWCFSVLNLVCGIGGFIVGNKLWICIANIVVAYVCGLFALRWKADML